MINPKNICISAAIGFFLSLFIVLISPSVHFSALVFLRPIIVALVFAVLCVGITFVYQKFLLNDNSNSFSVDTDTSPQKAAGSVVNIVVDDSNLSDDGTEPKFTVLNNHSDLKQDSVPVKEKKVESVPAVSENVPVTEKTESVPESKITDSQSAAFKPVSLGAQSSPVPAEAAPKIEKSSPSNEEGEKTEQLDELPDIGSMTIASSENSDSDLQSVSNEVVDDTEFATGGAKLREQPISGDTNVMAKAIQTLLAQDNN